MGFKIVYNRAEPPYLNSAVLERDGTVYEHSRPELVLVGAMSHHIHLIKYRQDIGFTSIRQAEYASKSGVTVVAKDGFFRSEYKGQKAFFFVDSSGAVLEFETENRLGNALREYRDRNPSWDRNGRQLQATHQEPVRRKFMREPLTRFDRIDRNIVADLPSVPRPKALTPEVPDADEDGYGALLSAAVDEIEAEDRRKAKAPVDPMAGLLDDFLKNL